MPFSAEYRVKALGADSPGNGQEVVVQIASSAVQRCRGQQANQEFQGKMTNGAREGSTGQRLDLIQVGAQPPLIWMASLLPALQDRRDRKDMPRNQRTAENDPHRGSIADEQDKRHMLRRTFCVPTRQATTPES